MKPTVFIPEPIAKVGLELLEAECDCLIPWQATAVDPDEFNSQAFRSQLFQVEAVVVRLFRIGSEDISRAGKLKVIAKHGVGLDNIDCEAATAAGVPVVYTPEANANAVAEHTLALMLGLARKLRPASEALMAGRFADRSRFSGIELNGRTLGIAGLGKIGRRVAAKAYHGLGMKVHGYDPFVSPDDFPAWLGLEETLEDLVRKSDILSLHLPLTSETRHLVNLQSLGWFKPGALLVNTSRGPVVDEDALVRALHQRTLAGAALDVFEQEPVPADHPLLQAPNILLTPHISSSTREALDNMSRQAAQGLLDVLNGRRPEYVANPEVFEEG